MTAIALIVAALIVEHGLDRVAKAITASRVAPGPAIGAGPSEGEKPKGE